jgi:ferrous iron transport protein B
MYERGTVFLKTAGTVIFAMTIIIWALLYFPRPEAVAVNAREDFVAAEAANGERSYDQIEAQIARGDAATCDALDHYVAAAYVEQSYLGRFGRFIQPLFAPAGFDWKVSVGIVASFPAREVIISTMGVIYRLGDDVEADSDVLRQRMAAEVWPEGPRMGQPVYTLPMVLALMVFFALCAQCAATLAAIAREAGTGWAVASFTYMTILAWIAAVAVYQVGSL